LTHIIGSAILQRCQGQSVWVKQLSVSILHLPTLYLLQRNYGRYIGKKDSMMCLCIVHSGCYCWNLDCVTKDQMRAMMCKAQTTWHWWSIVAKNKENWKTCTPTREGREPLAHPHIRLQHVHQQQGTGVNQLKASYCIEVRQS
jgi:hypothetical protein